MHRIHMQSKSSSLRTSAVVIVISTASTYGGNGLINQDQVHQIAEEMKITKS